MIVLLITIGGVTGHALQWISPAGTVRSGLIRHSNDIPRGRKTIIGIVQSSIGFRIIEGVSSSHHLSGSLWRRGSGSCSLASGAVRKAWSSSCSKASSFEFLLDDGRQLAPEPGLGVSVSHGGSPVAWVITFVGSVGLGKTECVVLSCSRCLGLDSSLCCFRYCPVSQ